MKEHSVGERDVVIGITASGTTPFVRAALRTAKQQGARTILLCSNPLSQHDPDLDLAIEVPTGPEVLSGSTRLKAGTAAKLVLNMITTATMVRMGKAYSNLMVDVHASNEKLRKRAERIIRTLTPLDEESARKLLDQARGRVKVALVMHKRQVDYDQASELLHQHDGFLRPILKD